MKLSYINSGSRRALLEQVRKDFEGIVPKEDIRLHEFKIYTKLQPGTPAPTFALNANGGNISVLGCESLQDTKDICIVDRYAIGIHPVTRVNVATGNFKVGDLLPGNSPILFYPDKNTFSTTVPAGSVASEVMALEALYNGKLTFKTLKTDRVSNLPLNSMRVVPQTQNGATTHASYDGIPYQPLETCPLLLGSQTNIAMIDMQGIADLTNIAGNGTTVVNYSVLFLSCILIVGGSTPEFIAASTINGKK
jgi:hypothetical protein